MSPRRTEVDAPPDVIEQLAQALARVLVAAIRRDREGKHQEAA